MNGIKFVDDRGVKNQISDPKLLACRALYATALTNVASWEELSNA